ncbi:hypothetical protein DSO57_1037364 [Entomophthora muscae]|uniref:Uncharacterized protein n=1 Tax=Entomophthora muscae TaxID=34485 RepID=A0ACC2SN74_9FUNG|nr:hypothetical protein DSO57_1037364 [Entomophthora muscae]
MKESIVGVERLGDLDDRESWVLMASSENKPAMGCFLSSADAGVVSNVVLVGLKLPAYVDLNQEVDWMLPGLGRVPSESQLKEVEAQIKQGGVLKMDYSPCSRDVTSHEVKGCSSYISAGDYRYVVKLPESNVFAGKATMHSSQVPLSSLLTFTEGDAASAGLVIAAGVEFAAVETLAACDVVSTPEISMGKTSYFSLYSPKLQRSEFDSNWSNLVAEFDKIYTISSPQTGPLTLSRSHHQSLMRTLSTAKNFIQAKYLGDVIPRVKIVAAGCKNVTGTAVYGSNGTQFTSHPINLKSVILDNSEFPGEYFSALLSFSAAPYRIPFM